MNQNSRKHNGKTKKKTKKDAVKLNQKFARNRDLRSKKLVRNMRQNT